MEGWVGSLWYPVITTGSSPGKRGVHADTGAQTGDGEQLLTGGEAGAQRRPTVGAQLGKTGIRDVS